MTDRKIIYETLRQKMEDAGFVFEREQRPHRQKRKEFELVFVHPGLVNKFEEEGYKVNTQKFYIKPLTDAEDCEIGFVTGKSSPLHKLTEFVKPNTIDSYQDTPSWTNKENDDVLNQLLNQIKSYINSFSTYVDKNTKTFLFTWNPQKWNWVDLQENIDHLEKVGYLQIQWSCGNSKNIKKGDRIFLVRLGEEPRGIMGSGYAKSSYYVAPHWDGTVGKTANYIDIEFDILINPEKNKLFSSDDLNNVDPNKTQQWFPQKSGIEIKPEIASSLESNWLDFIRENKYIGTAFLSNDIDSDETASYMEGKSKEVIQTRYERNPQARKICLKHFGYSCKICGFNFEQTFGEIGKGFIHVHHINAIADIGKEYEINPKEDLIPLCPNCHAMIHAKRPAFSVDEIKEIIKTRAHQ
ncbi:MAG TPA: HNH endonuclease [Saprospiraceae bacterium]|jgi:5-methylcytosine-specific restriction protein A|nr:HNH endonuclease [Saprospiraceae bacterium]HRP84531.1 HNH endonuclease [Saprospiraceae bacterium]